MKKKIIASFFLILGLAVLAGCGCKSSSSSQYSITLEVWGPMDDSFTYTDIFETYRKLNPNIKEVTYRRFSQDTYEKELIEALASGQGPDIFLIHNNWLPSFADKILPAPVDVFSEQKFRSDFVDVCAHDFVANGAIWAAPLSVDSLGLYYNKDLFNEAGITAPPKDWNEFLTDAQRLTKISNGREITQSGAALGTAYNINRATDVLNMLMLQSGADMIDDNGNITMGDAKIVNNATYFPAQSALTFYTQFAQSSSPYYTWNSRQHYSIDAFSEGKAAMMFNYSWHLQTIQDKAPKLNFAVASVPQFPGTTPVNYANYWGFAVAKNKQTQTTVTNDTRVKEAWKFIKFLTAKPDGLWSATSSSALGKSVDPNFDPSASYITATNKPAARRDLIAVQTGDTQLGVFAKDNLIAKSWVQKEPDTFESIMAEMINQVNIGQFSITDAINSAKQKMIQISNN